MARRFSFLQLFLSVLVVTPLAAQQQQTLASIFGQLRVARGDFPSHQIMIELQFRGSTIYSTYADGDGKFGFVGLVEGEYHILINDGTYEPVDERLMVAPETSANVMAFITLRPREAPGVNVQAQRQSGSNPHMLDLREYNRRFPKKAVKEYDKGLKADAESKHDEAISHYQAALQIAPDYYPAHNNLGSEFLGKADFADARKEFVEVVQLNQGDATGFFNLSNVCMMMGQTADAQHYLEEGMRRDPDSALGHFLLGSLDLRTGKLQQAEAALRQAIQLSPTMAQPRLQLVNLMLQQGRRSDASSELQEFVKSFPDSPFAPRARQLLQKLQASTNTPAAAK